MHATKQDTTRDDDQDRHASGPLAGQEPAGHRPLEDPALADRANPRWAEDMPPSDTPDGVQSMANADGTPNVMPPRQVEIPVATPDERAHGTPQDQAARPLDPDVGRDNIRAGRGGGTPNPAMAEGGENG